MKKKLIIIGLALAMLFGMGYKNQAEAYTTVSFSLFFNALAPYGNWISTPDYGYVWSPAEVGPDWRPYTNGHWVWSDYGWTWVSYEPWGWAPYHYGRWVFLDYYGWVWIPGTVWAPAWVTWYTSPGYIGWAPLPPDNDFFLGISIGFNSYNSYSYDYYTPPSHCVFVPSHHFLHHHVHSVVVPHSHNVTIIKNTTNITNIKVVNRNVVNYGPSVSLVEKATRAKIQKVNLIEKDIDTHTVVKAGANVNKVKGRNYYVFRPDVVKKRNETPLLKKESIKNTVQIRNRNEVIYPDHKKAIKKDEGFPNQDNLKNPTNREYPMKWDNKKGNSFVRENTVRSHNPDIHSENGYPVYKNTGKQFSKDSIRSRNNLKQIKESNDDSYSYPQMNQRSYYKTNPDIRGQEFQKRGFKNSNDRDLDSDTYQNQRQTSAYQNNLRKELRPSRHFGN